MVSVSHDVFDLLTLHVLDDSESHKLEWENSTQQCIMRKRQKTKFQLSSFNNTHWNYMSAPYWAILGKFLWHRYVPLNWCQQFLHGKIWIYCARKITFVPVLLPKGRSKKKIAFGPLLDFITIGWLIYQNDWGDVSLSIRLHFSELWMFFPAFFFLGNWMFFPVSLLYSIHLYLLKVDDRDTENLRHIITILKKLQFYFYFYTSFRKWFVTKYKKLFKYLFIMLLK